MLQYASKSYTMPDLDGVLDLDVREELTSLGADQDLIESAILVEDDREWCSVGAQVPDPGVRYNRTGTRCWRCGRPADDVEDCLLSEGDFDPTILRLEPRCSKPGSALRIEVDPVGFLCTNSIGKKPCIGGHPPSVLSIIESTR